jgi:hypothetical protein
MAIRADLNEVLVFIDCETLTDEEFDALDVDSDSTDREQFDALKSVLASREAVSNSYARLTSYFKAKGLTFTDDEVEPLEATNIFLGAALED